MEFGEAMMKVLRTLGRTSGNISLLGKVFTGDTLYEGSIGRTDFPESSDDDMKLSLKNLTCLSDQLVVCLGQGANDNPWLRKGQPPVSVVTVS
jgi:glyoxylase-like metal-dependent hydrolase (beta-lactamase superfamily II)